MNTEDYNYLSNLGDVIEIELNNLITELIPNNESYNFKVSLKPYKTIEDSHFFISLTENAYWYVNCLTLKEVVKKDFAEYTIALETVLSQYQEFVEKNDDIKYF
ncbi:hypothetical protein [Carnobacterium maltaromaticum]|uniref:hypothetical protein n=1 Tax=Carnobacterium maltaromaticum TaxID=2751 RepID=UPI00295F3E35|nr:hypothetical protein [Carnobacterium maltaromaticum]